uniref:ATPase AAA-type core domain-containing protein n=1 Tax=viral metagenome TaxID=1070528 RepID=A0A6C0M048_9ZZZZ
MPSRYNLRRRTNKTTWVSDETLKKPEEPPSDSDEEEYTPPSESESEAEAETDSEEEEEEEEEEEVPQIVLPRGSKVSVKLHLHTIVGGNSKLKVDDSESESEESESEDDFIDDLMDKYVNKKRGSGHKKKEEDGPALELNEDEEEYYHDLSKSKRHKLNEQMKRLSGLVQSGEVPYKFRVLDLAIPDAVKASVIKKIDVLTESSMEGEGFKLRTWVDSFFRIPFGKHVPLPVKLADGPEPCSKFLSESSAIMNNAVYGMNPAKTQVMQILAQLVSNPGCAGNVIALKGPMGVGKTSFAKNGVAMALKRPFEFFSLGGASDASTFVGHSFTYEGSTWGRIADAVMNARCMNPVLYFDEVDKISTTSHGEEIVNMLIHLTDRSQNSQFHDRYFAGVDIDLSQCLFVFSFNDESKIHPVLKDRMQIIECTGYTADEKKTILTKFIAPQVLDRIQLKGQLNMTDEAIRYIISEYSSQEQGVRTLIRTVETLGTRINLLRIADEETAKSYPFYRKITFPCMIDVELARHILQEKPQVESWRSMYN